MTVRCVLAQMTVTDLDRAEAWYAALFGSGPDLRPMDGLLEWRFGPSCGVQVFTEPDRAGRSAMVLDESDLDGLVSRLDAAGIAHEGPMDVTASRVVMLADPDGNRIVFSEPFTEGRSSAMSKIVVSSMISLDGCTEGRDGDVSAMPMDMAFAEHNADLVRHAGHLLFGATSYRGMLGYWPHQVDNPDANPYDRYIAGRYADGIPLTVVSDSLAPSDLEVWADQTTIVRRADAHAAVTRLREADSAGDVLIFGSRTLWTDLLAHGLVDELYVLVGPKIVAGDHRAFTGVPETALALLDVRSFRDSGTVVLRYAVGDRA